MKQIIVKLYEGVVTITMDTEDAQILLDALRNDRPCDQDMIDELKGRLADELND